MEGLVMEDGLSQSHVFDLIQSQQGYLWMPTKSGLNRYDGTNIALFKHEEADPFSMSDGAVRQIYESRSGLIWMYIDGQNEINVFDPTTERFYRFTVEQLYEDCPMPNCREIYAFCEDNDGNIWVSIMFGSVYKLCIPESFRDDLSTYDPSEEHSISDFICQRFEVPYNTRKYEKTWQFIYSIALASDGRLLMGGASTIFAVHPDSSQLIPLTDIGKDNPLRGGRKFQGNATDHSGGLWFISDNGELLVQYDNGAFNMFPIDTEYRLKSVLLAIDQYDQLYISAASGCYTMSLPTKSQPSPPLRQLSSNSHIRKRFIMVDSTNMVWWFIPKYGLAKINPYRDKFSILQKGESAGELSSDATGQLLFYKSRIQNKYFFMDRHSGEEIEIPIAGELPHFLSSYSNKLWFIKKSVCTVDIYTGEKRCVDGLGDFIGTTIHELANGDVFIGSDLTTLSRVNAQTMEISHFRDDSLSKSFKGLNTVKVIYQDVHGDLYLCTNEGLIKVTLDDEENPMTFHLYQNNASDPFTLSSSSILSAMDDPVEPETYLWVGTKGGGLNKMNKFTGQCRRVSIADGLPDDVIYGILDDDDGNIWMSTNRGICRYDPIKEDFRYFTPNDGLQSMEFNTGSYLKLPTVELAFGGVRGVNIFHPADLQFNTYNPPVLISSLKVNNEEAIIQGRANMSTNKDRVIIDGPINQLTSVELRHDQNLVAIGYAALDFTHPEQNRYQYILEGHDNSWNDVGHIQQALYSNLSPGDYTFRVKGTNSDGQWSSKEAKLQIKIMAPWYMTNTAYVLYFLLLASLIAAFYRMKIRRVRLQSQLDYEHREAERLTELDRLKTSLFSNITHELRTPLTLIIEPLRQVLSRKLSPELRQPLGLVRKNSERLLVLVNQLLDMSKLEAKQMKVNMRSGNLLDVLQPIYRSFLMLADHSDVELQMKTIGTFKQHSFDKLKLEKILTNLLSNAIKFTPSGFVVLTVEVRVTPESQRGSKAELNLIVSDTGIGIPSDQLPHIFDRFHQVDSSTTRAGEGTGIGLALTKELVELMEGTIEVSSVLGEGSTFAVTLPLYASSDYKAQETLFSKENPSGLSPALLSAHQDQEEDVEVQVAQGKNNLHTILLVEDNTELRTFIRQSLNQSFLVIEASNGQDGIDKATQVSVVKIK